MLISAISQGQLPVIIILGVLVVGLGVWTVLLYAKKSHSKPSEKPVETSQPIAQSQVEQSQVTVDQQPIEEEPIASQPAPVVEEILSQEPVDQQPAVEENLQPVATEVEQPIAVQPEPVAEPVVEEVAVATVEQPSQTQEPTVAEQQADVVEKPTEKPVVVIKRTAVEQPIVAQQPVAPVTATKPQPTFAPTSVVPDDKILVRYNKSFLAKLIQSSDATKEFYAIIYNRLRAHKGVKCRVSWKCATFNRGRKQLAKISVKGKTLNLNVALNPSDYQDAKFKVYDDGARKSLAKVALRIKVKSNRGVKYACKLIDDLASQLQLVALPNAQQISASEYPYQDTQSLVHDGLIKVKDANGKIITDLDNVISHPFAIHQSVTVEQAHAEITDEVAMTLVVAGSGVKARGKKFIVNIDTLSDSFQNDDVVDIDALKQKGIAPKSCKAIKILARGTLDKKLTVIADDYSADAIKMIVLVGGTAKLN